jgi:RNA-directed DNA polymerase
MVKAGYIEWDNKKKSKTIHPDYGVPQGGIISPLLSNVILHELDQHMERLMEEKNRANIEEKPYIKNKIYSRLSSKIASLVKKKTGDFRIDKENRKEIRKIVQERRKHKTITHNPKYIRYEYVRYADD